MKTISLITVFNNIGLLNRLKETALLQKNVQIDYVFIDNQSGRFSCAAVALNFGFSQAKGDVIVFLHQDIEFVDDITLEYIFDFAVSHPNTLFGAAGVHSRNEESFNRTLLSSMYSGPNKKKNDGLDGPRECFTLDECLIACHRSVMDKLAFDEKVCNCWHLYGADLCLQAQITEGLNVMAIPMNIWHKSNGNADRNYFQTQDCLAKKYKKYFKVINTTNGYQYTDALPRILLNISRAIKYGLLRLDK